MKIWQSTGIINASHGAVVVQEQCDRSEQEDAIGTQAFGDELHYVVCDGMGGHDAGAEASRVAARAFLRRMSVTGHTGQAASLKARIDFAVIRADAAVRKLSGIRMPGTTIVAAIVTPTQVGIAHVGDSRAWVVFGDGRLKQVTTDHNVAAECRARGGPAGYGANILTRALGVGENVYADVVVFDRADVDAVLLASDGLHGALARRLDHDDLAVAAVIDPVAGDVVTQQWLARLRREVMTAPGDSRLDNLSMLAWRGQT